jgi:hypothetical protein
MDDEVLWDSIFPQVTFEQIEQRRLPTSAHPGDHLDEGFVLKGQKLLHIDRAIEHDVHPPC